MSRTTLNIDDPILWELKAEQEKLGKSLGRLVSELLAEALARRRKGPARRPPFRWVARPMGARVDLSDKESVWSALEGSGDSTPS
ncbi:MAG: antitoxin [Planctomycetes bacterium]|nr:antitoxin [Planctomycetota bacterium]